MVLAYQTFLTPAETPKAPAVTSAPLRAPVAAAEPQATVLVPDAASAPPPAADLTTLLQAAEPLASVMSGLIRLWDSQLVLTRADNVCRKLSAHALECYKSTGEWADLRTLNRPAVLSLTTGRGEVQHVLLRGLAATQATIETAHGPLAVPLEQLDALWTGEFLLLWKHETPDLHLAPGARGPSVLWVRRRLAELTGTPLAKPLSDRFDAALSQDLKRFQTTRGLDSDGLVGVRTLVALGDGLSGTPTLVTP